MRVGITDLPLHYGKAPKWLFKRMVLLGKEISKIIIMEFGKDEYLRRISNPYFFQALGCVLGYDWHSSGLTTTLTAALKEGLNRENIGIKIFGGKGSTSRKTPIELESLEKEFGFSSRKIEELKYASKMVAKVDNSAIQDGYKLYHHAFIVSENGKWAVIQQGMNENNKIARRYHWISENVKDFVCEPHFAIVGIKEKNVLNMVAKESEEARKASVDLVKEDVRKFKRFFYSNAGLVKYLKMPIEHTFDLSVYKKLEELHEFNPKNYEELLSFKGVGPKTVRALALIAKIIYGTEASWIDPCKYTFAHGGKDKIPYPIDRKTYDESIRTLKEIIEKAEIGDKEKIRALKILEERFSF
ncbi:MAG: DUF763 domain-containing protein [Candidatus Aenigmatarchaeota archaeon]